MATASGLTRAEKQARTRAALLDAAARVFVERGFQRASVELIAAEAGFTRGAFYSNFASKEELFLALCARSAESTIAAVRERVTSIEDRGLDAAGEVLQTETATVGTTITGRQIIETPIPSRDAGARAQGSRTRVSRRRDGSGAG